MTFTARRRSGRWRPGGQLPVLKRDHPGIARVHIPSTLGGSPLDFLARPKVLEEMRAFLAAIACEDYKIIVFDGGEDDAEANGYCAIMMASGFDCRTHLDANGLREAAIEVGYGH